MEPHDPLFDGEARALARARSEAVRQKAHEAQESAMDARAHAAYLLSLGHRQWIRLREAEIPQDLLPLHRRSLLRPTSPDGSAE